MASDDTVATLLVEAEIPAILSILHRQGYGPRCRLVRRNRQGWPATLEQIGLPAAFRDRCHQGDRDAILLVDAAGCALAISQLLRSFGADPVVSFRGRPRSTVLTFDASVLDRRQVGRRSARRAAPSASG